MSEKGSVNEGSENEGSETIQAFSSKTRDRVRICKQPTLVTSPPLHNIRDPDAGVRSINCNKYQCCQASTTKVVMI